jgi:hypothetical protein
MCEMDKSANEEESLKTNFFLKKKKKKKKLEEIYQMKNNLRKTMTKITTKKNSIPYIIW